MNVLVAYASRLGSTKEIADRIGARLRSRGIDGLVRPVESIGDLTPYDAFVIGSAVYAGQWLSVASRFIRDNQAALSGRQVWLFSSGPIGETATRHQQVEPADIPELRSIVLAADHRVFAGSFDRGTVEGSDLGFGERFIARRFVPEGDYRDWPEIEAWADEIATGLLAAQSARRGRQPAAVQ
jgi:menaquinone-dependent protoporphyrinogen oxidase